MMSAIPRRSWIKDFERASGIRDEIYRREQLARFEAREREKQKNEDREMELRDMEMYALVQMVIASPNRSPISNSNWMITTQRPLKR